MPGPPIPTWCFALVIVRLGRRFLVVQERKHGQRWYLPAGRVEPGETFVEAARRETLEEAGIHIVPDGLVRVEHAPMADGTARCRVIFTAHPADDRPPKSAPDADSLGARWVTLDDLALLPLRGDEVVQLFAYVDAGGATYPLGVFASESSPLPTVAGAAPYLD